MFARLVPGPLVRFFARPYVAGGSMESALASAETLLADGLLSTLDLLGEDVENAAAVDVNKNAYIELIDEVARRFIDVARRPTVSVKPSAFCVGFDDSAFDVIETIVEHAHERKVAVTIDMEDHRWTDITLQRSVELFQRGFAVGTVLQTRLHRTESDLQKIPEGMRVRLVIGIYPEPADIATTDKGAMKERMLTFAQTLVSRGVYVEFATHDEPTLRRFAREVAPNAPDRCEVQMLLGVPRSTIQKELRTGAPALAVRLYVPFALGWSDATAYLRRRMAESPSMMFLVLRNLASRDR